MFKAQRTWHLYANTKYPGSAGHTTLDSTKNYLISFDMSLCYESFHMDLLASILHQAAPSGGQVLNTAVYVVFKLVYLTCSSKQYLLEPSKSVTSFHEHAVYVVILWAVDI
ncbi:hypothetical protein Ddye_023668 [Dipteronia dyeriana]|uniref:Uncharacterized protein n=1 Tax=Dipteronia dyeriana TaxID=168575 RepID=A0AAD9TUB5_9ROSI|nr:hypothetical protein Ddye_023668 [Dipteronia dyeriana]